MNARQAGVRVSKAVSSFFLTLLNGYFDSHLAFVGNVRGAPRGVEVKVVRPVNLFVIVGRLGAFQGGHVCLILKLLRVGTNGCRFQDTRAFLRHEVSIGVHFLGKSYVVYVIEYEDHDNLGGLREDGLPGGELFNRVLSADCLADHLRRLPTRVHFVSGRRHVMNRRSHLRKARNATNSVTAGRRPAARRVQHYASCDTDLQVVTPFAVQASTAAGFSHGRSEAQEF